MKGGEIQDANHRYHRSCLTLPIRTAMHQPPSVLVCRLSDWPIRVHLSNREPPASNDHRSSAVRSPWAGLGLDVESHVDSGKHVKMPCGRVNHFPGGGPLCCSFLGRPAEPAPDASFGITKIITARDAPSRAMGNPERTFVAREVAGSAHYATPGWPSGVVVICKRDASIYIPRSMALEHSISPRLTSSQLLGTHSLAGTTLCAFVATCPSHSFSPLCTSPFIPSASLHSSQWPRPSFSWSRSPSRLPDPSSMAFKPELPPATRPRSYLLL